MSKEMREKEYAEFLRRTLAEKKVTDAAILNMAARMADREEGER